MNEDLIYTCGKGESFDWVALLLYGHEKHAVELLAANPDLCHKLRFDGGEQLYVPAIEVDDIREGIENAEPVSPPPWKS